MDVNMSRVCMAPNFGNHSHVLAPFESNTTRNLEGIGNIESETLNLINVCYPGGVLGIVRDVGEVAFVAAARVLAKWNSFNGSCAHVSRVVSGALASLNSGAFSEPNSSDLSYIDESYSQDVVYSPEYTGYLDSLSSWKRQFAEHLGDVYEYQFPDDFQSNLQAQFNKLEPELKQLITGGASFSIQDIFNDKVIETATLELLQVDTVSLVLVGKRAGSFIDSDVLDAMGIDSQNPENIDDAQGVTQGVMSLFGLQSVLNDLYPGKYHVTVAKETPMGIYDIDKMEALHNLFEKTEEGSAQHLFSEEEQDLLTQLGYSTASEREQLKELVQSEFRFAGGSSSNDFFDRLNKHSGIFIGVSQGIPFADILDFLEVRRNRGLQTELVRVAHCDNVFFRSPQLGNLSPVTVTTKLSSICDFFEKCRVQIKKLRNSS